jgi:hypothetical protein
VKRFIVTSAEEENLRTLHVDETAYVCVYADQLWNDSGIDMGWGQRYTIIVPPGEKWTSGRRTCDADGYSSSWLMRPSEKFRRVPEAKWSQLIGAIGRSTKSAIIIGKGSSDLLVRFPGRLYLFANDLPWLCWKNKGTIAVRVTRTK